MGTLELIDRMLHPRKSENRKKSSSTTEVEIPISMIKVEKLIGCGAHAEVFRAKYGCSTVAVKLFCMEEMESISPANSDSRANRSFRSFRTKTSVDSKRLASCPDQLGSGSFENEAAMFSTCRHPNIVQFYGVVFVPHGASGSSRAGLVMEYAARGTLMDLLCETDIHTLNWTMRTDLAVQIARGMEYLHCRRQKVFHRDLKPENVLICENQQAKISDFGLSQAYQRPESRKCTPMKVSGTAVYLAPEVFEDQVENYEAADVYSYGILLWVLAHLNSGVIDVLDHDSYFQTACSLLFDRLTVQHRVGQVVCFKELWGFQMLVAEKVPEHLSSLIRACTHEGPRLRPKFEDIIMALTESKPC